MVVSVCTSAAQYILAQCNGIKLHTTQLWTLHPKTLNLYVHSSLFSSLHRWQHLIKAALHGITWNSWILFSFAHICTIMLTSSLQLSTAHMLFAILRVSGTLYAPWQTISTPLGSGKCYGVWCVNCMRSKLTRQASTWNSQISLHVCASVITHTCIHINILLLSD